MRPTRSKRRPVRLCRPQVSEPRTAEAPAAPAQDAQCGTQVLLALVAGQIGLHAAMAGVRLAAPLLALRDGHGALAVGLLMALYAAAPALLSMPAGRLADRHGYHRPVAIAIGLSLLGAVLALAAAIVAPATRLALLGLSAVAVGCGANLGLIAIQRTAGLAARSGAQRVRMFSWLSVAPSLSNAIGPVLAGVLIDRAGFAAAFAAMLALPLLTGLCMRWVPREPASPTAAAAPAAASGLALLATPGLKRLLGVNWLISASWDVHQFVVPILGFERGFSGATIGLILGSFTLAVTAVRLAMPLAAHRIAEVAVLRAAMIATASVFALYPLVRTPWLMATCAGLLGLALGAVQPMMLAMLHRLSPAGRHGELIAMRAMIMNASSTVMPLAFGAAGSVIGAAALFWLMGAAVAAGSWPARRLRAAASAPD
jgi:MFS family permease